MMQPYQVVHWIDPNSIVDYDIYLFINTKSGAQIGMRFLSLQVNAPSMQMEKVYFKLHGLRVEVSFYDHTDTGHRGLGLTKLKASEEMGNKCRVIVCGGDGTILWVVKEMVQYGVNIHNVPIGVIPIGTGNDFSRQLGWGGKQQALIGQKFDKLKELVFEWIDAEIQNFDVWSMKFTTYERGFFKEIKDKSENVMTGVAKIEKSFTNYCGLGIDARIGWSFDKRRSKSRAVNLVIYAWVGLLRSCNRRIKMNQMIHDMEQYVSFPGSMLNSANMSLQTNYDKFNEGSTMKPLVSKSAVFLNQPNSTRQLKKSYQNLVALNINSFMGGCHDMWGTDKIAVTGIDNSSFGPQSNNDGIIEFVSWESETGLGLERMANKAAKVAQGRGPFVINFNPPKTEDQHTFFHVDGQYFKVYQPRQLIIERSTKIPQGMIRVLRFRGRRRSEFKRDYDQA